MPMGGLTEIICTLYFSDATISGGVFIQGHEPGDACCLNEPHLWAPPFVVLIF